MNNFEILSRFLEKYGDDVEGRELDEMPAEIKQTLNAFARGGLAQADRQKVVDLLKENPRWVGLLAAEARAARNTPGAKG
jgi:hypothetical protein